MEKMNTMKKMTALGLALTGLMLSGCGGGETAPTKASSGASRTLSSEMKVTAEWVSIPAGSFTMGSNRYDNKDEKERRVTMKAGAYEIMKHPVTNGMYKQWIDGLPEAEREANIPADDRVRGGGWVDGWFPKGKADHPVTNVTYIQAKAYAEANGWQIPSSAQWEKAARGDSDNRDYPWGGEIDATKATYGNPRGSTVKVGGGGVSPYGAYDMAGNVWEWTRSSYDKNNPGRELVLAGGSFGSTAGECMTHNRMSAAPTVISIQSGFRCVK